MPDVKRGDRVEVTGVMNDPQPIPVGTQGTVVSVNEYQIGVKWDIDRGLFLLPEDPFRVVT